MTQLLQQAFERAAALPQEDQDIFARFILAELESEERWAELFSRPESEEFLEKMSDEALAYLWRKKLNDLYGVFADGKPSLSKSEEREVATKAKSARYTGDSSRPSA